MERIRPLSFNALSGDNMLGLMQSAAVCCCGCDGCCCRSWMILGVEPLMACDEPRQCTTNSLAECVKLVRRVRWLLRCAAL